MLKQITAKKAKHKGRIARLNELLSDLFHFSDAERTSFKERRTISPTTTAAPYWGRPGLVIIEIALAEIALDDIILNSITMPPYITVYFLNKLLIH